MNIAVFLPNWVGDAVMATPAVYALRERYPAAHFIGVVRPYVAGVLDGSYWFNEYLSLDPRGPLSQRTLAVARRLRQRQQSFGPQCRYRRTLTHRRRREPKVG